MTENVTIKCSGNALEFWVGEAPPYSEIYDALRSRLDANAAFYAGSDREVIFFGRHFSQIQKRELRSMLAKDYDLRKIRFSDEEETPAETVKETAETPTENLFLTQTVRGGQLIRTTGDITIIGDVNAGAEIIAGGNVAVFGSLRGLVHAGAFGRQDVVVVAHKLMANQIRIGGKIAVLPKNHRSAQPEMAKLSPEGKIVITALN